MKYKILIAALMVAAPVAFAETDTTTMTAEMTTEAQVVDAETSSMTSTQAVERVASGFTDFLGEQSATVVEGLRTGEEFTLTSSYTDATGVQQTETITIEPPTSKMGYGNVNITLKLAENQLALAGITEPTAIQLESALLGGSITTTDGQVVDMQGVLTLRSEGMGWGQIAKQYDTKLGFIMGKGQGAAKASSITTASGDTTSTGAGKSHKVKTTKASVSAGGKGHAYGNGIVSASGASIGAGVSANASAGGGKVHGGGGHAYGRGIVSAGGSSAGHSSNAGGNGKGRGRVK